MSKAEAAEIARLRGRLERIREAFAVCMACAQIGQAARAASLADAEQAAP